MGTPHKHAEIIKAWADGAKVEVKHAQEWLSIGCPTWNDCCEYRIKPEPKPDVVRYGVAHLGPMLNGCVDALGGANLREDNNLKLTFDGETGALKAAEVLK